MMSPPASWRRPCCARPSTFTFCRHLFMERIANHLIREKSPYLLQHLYNPVDWHPWGPEAFELARRENKPILVSIGYSTCHWCHVMERESYEDPAVAAVMNQFFINIKVDREERPDVDKIYMAAVSALTGSGGWPLNVFLTPELKPIFGGTYFPPAPRGGQPAWKDVVSQIGRYWQDPQERAKMLLAGDEITRALRQYAEAAPAGTAQGDPSWLEGAYDELRGSYDAARGGFGGAPKFPMPVYHHFLLRYGTRTGRKEALEMSLHTLRQMSWGGIYDQFGGGFCRYATDASWRVPHFEKMLYDNAQLAVSYLEAFQISQDPDFKKISEEILNYALRDLEAPAGGFYCAEDADSLPSASSAGKEEGAFYVWEKTELMQIAGEKAGDLFAFRYGVREDGNVESDPRGEFKNKNILYAART